MTYPLGIGEAIDGLAFSTTFPRGAVARCDVALKLVVQARGRDAPRSGDAQVFAQQIRSVSIAMR